MFVKSHGAFSSRFFDSRRTLSFWAIFLFVSLCTGCVHLQPGKTPEATPSLVKVCPNDWPGFSDDMDRLSFLQCLDQSRRYLRALPSRTSFRFGNEEYPVQHMLLSLDRLEEIWRGAGDRKELRNMIVSEFDLYMSSAGKDGVLFTGYYEPILNVSFVKSDHYRFPLYRLPNDLLTADLKMFGIDCGASRITGRVNGGKFVPYFDRHQIDDRMVLADRGLEIAWADDPLDVFFLQIQGSGMLRFEDGEYVRVGFDGQNGRPYKAIGKVLLDEGRIPRDRVSMQTIRAYLEEHRNELERVLNTNPSYVFFKILPEGPVGSIGVRLTAGRSIATDSRTFPKGAPAFIVSAKPEADWRGNVAGWKSYSRFVFNQDTGGAIRGSGRVDVFWGNGEYARAAAGYSKAKGTLYFLVLKKESGREG